MLVIPEEINAYVQEVKDFAAKIGLAEQLQNRLDYLDNYAGKWNSSCHLSRDFAPYSFTFRLHHLKEGIETFWFFGGLIFHGPHDNGGDGSAPTFSVNLQPHHGWAIHT